MCRNWQILINWYFGSLRAAGNRQVVEVAAIFKGNGAKVLNSQFKLKLKLRFNSIQEEWCKGLFLSIQSQTQWGLRVVTLILKDIGKTRFWRFFSVPLSCKHTWANWWRRCWPTPLEQISSKLTLVGLLSARMFSPNFNYYHRHL